jgi:hypothetical protein
MVERAPIIASWVAVVAVALAGHPASAASKLVRIRAVEPTDDFKLIVFSRVHEEENKILFPVTTLDREAFTLTLGKSDPARLKPDSLSTFSTLAQPRVRRLVVTLPVAANVPRATLDDIRQTLAENLPLTRSEFFSVLSVTSSGELEVAGTSPGESDNVRALQKKILDAPPAGENTGIHQAVCAAAKKFASWAPYASRPGEQRAAILIGNPSVESKDGLKRLSACLDQLKVAEVAVYLLRADSIPPLPVGAEQVFQDGARLGGGFVQRISSRVDLYPALSNVLGNLNEEYVATFDLFSLIGTWEGRNAIAQDGVSYLDLGVSYHGQDVSSGMSSVPLPATWRDNIERINKAGTSREKAIRLFTDLNPPERIVAGVLAVILLVTLFFILRYWFLSIRLAMRSVRCRTCGLRVKRSFSNCPYRDNSFAGWLSILNGPDVGMVLPVMEGRNLLGTSDACNIHTGKGYRIRRKHAELLLDGGKAQLKLLRGGILRHGDQINGFEIKEPRLLCHGDVVKLGKAFMRFELRVAEQPATTSQEA